MNIKLDYKKLIMGLILLGIGLISSSYSGKFIEEKGGVLLFAQSNETTYYLVGNNDEHIEITKNEYFINNTIGLISIVCLVPGAILLFIFFVKSIFYRMKHPSKFT